MMVGIGEEFCVGAGAGSSGLVWWNGSVVGRGCVVPFFFFFFGCRAAEWLSHVSGGDV